jgi:hypothetical protein
VFNKIDPGKTSITIKETHIILIIIYRLYCWTPNITMNSLLEWDKDLPYFFLEEEPSSKLNLSSKRNGGDVP